MFCIERCAAVSPNCRIYYKNNANCRTQSVVAGYIAKIMQIAEYITEKSSS
jgi:hypothetical protein